MRNIFVFFAGNEEGGAAAHISTLARTLVRYGKADRYRFISLGTGPLYDKVRPTGVICESIATNPVTAVGQLAQYLHSAPKAMVHSHGPRLNILASFASRRTRVPWTSTIHSHPRYDFLGSSLKSRVYPRLHLWSLKSAIGLFVVQPDLAKELPVSTVLDVPNAIDLPVLEHDKDWYRNFWCEQFGLPAGTKFIGIAARFDPVKNISTLIQAMPSVKDAHLLLAGDGEEREKLEQLAVHLGVKERVHFLGFRSDMPSVYAALDIHILPSRSEGTPFCVLEAGTYGAVNIGSDIPGLRALLQDGRAGSLVPVGDVNQLSQDINRLLANEEERTLLKERFQADVLPNFSPKRMIDAYERGYTVLEEDLLRSRRYRRTR